LLDAVASRTKGTPEWRLLRLGARLAADCPRFDKLEKYWDGNPPLPHGNNRMREAYKRLQRLARTNFGSLVAETVLERLKVIGFRAGADATEEADKKAWSWWQANGLDADSGLVHRAAVIMSRSYVIVGEDPDDPGQPLVTVEDPRQVIHESAPTNRRKVVAALKTWWDETEGAQFAVLYLPEEIRYFRTTAGIKSDSAPADLWRASSWDVDDSEYADGVADNPLAPDVPVTPFVNRPKISGEGLGEFEDVIDMLDRVNTVILDRLVISAMQAYRQRWAKGISTTDENGNDNTSFDPGADLLWAVEDESAQFGEFNATDLTPIIKSVESDVQHIASITRTPPSYMLAGIVNASGDALAAAEVGLVSKCGERIAEFTESWERVYRLVGRQQGREIDTDAEVLWRDPQFRSLAELAAANVQLKAADVPWRTRMRLLDMTPSQIDRMEAERAHDQMMMMMGQMQMQPGMGTGMPLGPAGQPLDPNALPGEGQVSQTTPLSSGAGVTTTTGRRDSKQTESKQDTSISSGASWDDLYQRARLAGIKGASKMTKQQLLQLVGSG